jgi:class 3 adenylate cyclase/tetratricopeptide (TPR) repeat protein
VATCPNCGHENAEDAKFCSECGTRFVAAETPARESRKTVTVLFCDVTGSTALGERLDPETLRSVMTRYFERMSAVLESHGGTVEKFIGDAVMAVFGIPLVHEDDALRAVRAAAEMRAALADLNADLEREWSVSIEVRIGVNTGPVVAGDPASGQNLVTGDTVNTAARLEQAAAPGEILIGEATAHLVRDAVEAEPVDPLALKGKSDLVGASRLLEVRVGAAGHERRLDSPMVGRERPLRMLEDAFDATAADRTCHLFTVLGPAGIGKSRLVREFTSTVRGRAEVLSGRCLSYGDGIAYWPIAEIAIQAAGIAEDDPPERARAALRETLGDIADADLVAAHLAGVMGLAGDGPVEAPWAVRRFLEAIASRRPLVVVVDDIHWAEPALLDVLEHVADRSRDVPILLLCMARPEFLESRPGWSGGMRNATSAHLEPLSEPEADALIENLLGLPALTAEIRERIRSAAQGNPLFVEEVLAMLLDDGVLVPKEGEWVATVDLTTVHVPPAISALLSARLDRLSSDERIVTETASVIGEVFERSTVRALLPETLRPEIDRHLGALLRKDLIRPSHSDLGGEEGFRFRHILIRDTAYETMPKAERAELHETFANHLASALGERVSEFDEFIGYHLEQAFRLRTELGLHDERTEGLARAAFERLRDAGVRAFQRWNHQMAATLLRHASELLDADDRERLAIAWRLGRALGETGSFDDATLVLEDALARARAAGLEAEADHAECMLVLIRVFHDPSAPLDEFDERMEVLRERRESAGDDQGSAIAWEQRAFASWMRERFADSGDNANRARSFARACGDGFIDVGMTGLWLAAQVLGPTPFDQALADAESALDEARARGSKRLEGDALRVISGCAAHLGDFARSRETIARSLALLDELGASVDFWAGHQAMARFAELEGRTDDAIAMLRDAERNLADVGETAFRSTITAVLATLEALRGDVEAARRSLSVAEETSSADDRASQVAMCLARGILAIGSDDDTADAEFERALALDEQSDSLVSQAETHLTVARAISDRRRDDAIGLTRVARDRAITKGSISLADRADALLTELGAG